MEQQSSSSDRQYFPPSRNDSLTSQQERHLKEAFADETHENEHCCSCDDDDPLLRFGTHYQSLKRSLDLPLSRGIASQSFWKRRHWLLTLKYHFYTLQQLLNSRMVEIVFYASFPIRGRQLVEFKFDKECTFVEACAHLNIERKHVMDAIPLYDPYYPVDSTLHQVPAYNPLVGDDIIPKF